MHLAVDRLRVAAVDREVERVELVRNVELLLVDPLVVVHEEPELTVVGVAQRAA